MNVRIYYLTKYNIHYFVIEITIIKISKNYCDRVKLDGPSSIYVIQLTRIDSRKKKWIDFTRFD